VDECTRHTLSWKVKLKYDYRFRVQADTRRGTHMSEERTTLRIDSRLLERVDMAVEEDVNIANRSHFFRVAAEEKLRARDGDYTSIRLPDGLRESLAAELESGMYSSVDEIIAECLRERYDIKAHTRELVRERMKDSMDTLRIVKK